MMRMGGVATSLGMNHKRKSVCVVVVEKHPEDDAQSR